MSWLHYTRAVGSQQEETRETTINDIVVNDNNDPFSSGRISGQPDPNEFIIIRLDRPLVEFDEDEK